MPSARVLATTAGRMDSYVDPFQANGGSMVMLAKWQPQRRSSMPAKHSAFYLALIGGPAAILAKQPICKVEGPGISRARHGRIWRIQVENFPAFIVTDDKGTDFFSELKL